MINTWKKFSRRKFFFSFKKSLILLLKWFPETNACCKAVKRTTLSWMKENYAVSSWRVLLCLALLTLCVNTSRNIVKITDSFPLGDIVNSDFKKKKYSKVLTWKNLTDTDIRIKLELPFNYLTLLFKKNPKAKQNTGG